MTTATIRVRINPADNDEYVIYIDPEDQEQPWVRAGGAVIGWEYSEYVADWPEYQLHLPTSRARRPGNALRVVSATPGQA